MKGLFAFMLLHMFVKDFAEIHNYVNSWDFQYF